jgi:hypothetical protein
MPPTRQVADLAGELGVKVGHQAGQLAGVFDPDLQVVVALRLAEPFERKTRSGLIKPRVSKKFV